MATRQRARPESNAARTENDHSEPIFDMVQHSSGLLKIEELRPSDMNKEFKGMTKFVEKQCPFDRCLFVRDISLKVRGPDEDKAFAQNPKMWLNIRRGNTILDFYDKNDKYQFSTVGRKGLNKFFDLALDYVSKRKRYDFKEEARGRFNSHNSYSLKNQILAGPKRAMEEGNQVELIKTLKANGENCQISWSQDANCWVISSKNVSLLAESKVQVQNKRYYNPDRKSRYFFAILIALQWFDILKRIEENQGAASIDNLKSDLMNRTMVGEYIGN